MPYERETFAKIFVNGEYVGLYLIVEPIDKRFLLSWFGEDTGYLYEGHGGEIQYRFKYRGDDPNAYLPETVPNVIGDHDGAIAQSKRGLDIVEEIRFASIRRPDVEERFRLDPPPAIRTPGWAARLDDPHTRAVAGCRNSLAAPAPAPNREHGGRDPPDAHCLLCSSRQSFRCSRNR